MAISQVLPGGQFPLYAIYNANNQATDVTNPQAVITDPLGNHTTVNLTLQTTGIYIGTYNLADNATLGFWNVVYYGTFGSNPPTPSNNLEVYEVVAEYTVNPAPVGYCTIGEVQLQFPFLLTKPNNTIQQFIYSAQSDIDSQLDSIYAVPFTLPVPPMINLMAQFYAGWYSLFSGLSKDLITKVGPGVAMVKKQADTWASELKAAKRTLPGCMSTQSQIQLSNGANPRVNTSSMYRDPLIARSVGFQSNNNEILIYPDGTPPYGLGAYWPGTLPAFMDELGLW